MKDYIFDDLERLAKEFPIIPGEEKISSSEAESQFEKELSELSV